MGEVRLEVEKETMMKIVGIRVSWRSIPQREDRGSEDPKARKHLADGKRPVERECGQPRKNQ